MIDILNIRKRHTLPPTVRMTDVIAYVALKSPATTRIYLCGQKQPSTMIGVYCGYEVEDIIPYERAFVRKKRKLHIPTCLFQRRLLLVVLSSSTTSSGTLEKQTRYFFRQYLMMTKGRSLMELALFEFLRTRPVSLEDPANKDDIINSIIGKQVAKTKDRAAAQFLAGSATLSVGSKLDF
jgi:hypothetical protein